MITKAKILVTGGAGFIGSNLCEALIQLGNQVVCLDNFATGKMENIAPLLQTPEFMLIKGDIRNMEDCVRSVEGVDYVLHEAALGSVPRSIDNPITTNDVNVSGFLNMLVAARNANVKRFVYAASSSTYGDSEALPKVEEVIGRPLSPYAITKFVNELYADVFSGIYGIKCTGLRYFNVFGPKQDPNGAYAAVIPLFIKQLMDHQSPKVNGDGEYSRDFTYIDNVVHMNLLALTIVGSKQMHNVYNTACGQRITLNQMVEYIIEFLSQIDPVVKSIDIIRGQNRSGDIPHSLADISKAKRELGYQPLVNVRDGLKKTCEWFTRKTEE